MWGHWQDEFVMSGTWVRGMGDEDLKISFTSTTVVTSLQPLLCTAFILAWMTAIEKSICVIEALEKNMDGLFLPTPESLLKNHSCNYGHVQAARMQAKKPTQSCAKCKASHIVNNVLKVLNHAARWKSKFTSRLSLGSVFGSVTAPHWATERVWIENPMDPSQT